MRSRHLRHALLVIALTALAACASSPDPVDSVEARFAADYEAGTQAFLAGDVPAAAALWEPWARKGRPDAQLGMGLVAETRAEGPEGIDEALDWYRRAGEQGQSAANVRRAELLMARGETEAAFDAYVHAASCGNSKAIMVLTENDIDFQRRSRCREARVVSDWNGRPRNSFPPYHQQPGVNSSIRVRSSAER